MPESLRVLPDRLIEWATVLVTIAMVGAVMLGVVSRSINEPLIWTDEASRYLLVWLAALGWVLTTRRRTHIRISFFADMLPAPVRRLLEIAIQSALTLFGALLAWKGVDLVAKNHDLEATTDDGGDDERAVPRDEM